MDDQCLQSYPLSELPEATVAEQELVHRLIQSLDRPEALVDEVIPGHKFVGVRAGDRMGLASTLGAEPNDEERALITDVRGQTLQEMARLLLSASPFSLTLGLAAINAGLDPGPGELDLPAERLIREIGRDRDVVIVGDFPFIDQIRPVVGRLHLLELRDIPGCVPRNDWSDTLQACDLAVITSTAILTRR